MNINSAAALIPQPHSNGIDADSRVRPQADRPQEEHDSRATVGPELPAPGGRPDGSDPALWETLNAAEQEYFSALQSIGSLSYGPGEGSAARLAPLGQRLDVRA